MDAGGGDGMCFPYDVLLDILRRLPGGAIAACKCVCRAWRAIIDAHDLSLDRYFPRRAFLGIFFTKIGCNSNCTFFAPSPHRRLYYPRRTTLMQSCNGLLLIEDDYGKKCVLNPATSRYALLPSAPTTCHRRELMSLAFDPAVSLHYDVFLILTVEESSSVRPAEDQVSPLQQVQDEGAKEPKEKAVPLLVYSSCTGQWESRAFTPGRCAPRHLYDVVARPPGSYDGAFWSSEYRRGSLYVHCHNNILMILRPSKGTYDTLELPEDNCGPKSRRYSLPRNSLLANYERGIHYVAIHGLQLRVWLLTESVDGQIRWTLPYDVNLNPHGHMIHPRTIQARVIWDSVGRNGGPASPTDDEEYYYEDEEEDLDGSEDSWNSDEDNFIDVDVGDATHVGPPAWSSYGSNIVGFHPHKNAIILVMDFAVVVYHLDTSMLQFLGNECDLLKDRCTPACSVEDAFTYRPCYEDTLPIVISSS